MDTTPLKKRLGLYLRATFVLSMVVVLAACASEATVPSADHLAPEASGSPVVLLDEDMDHYVAVDNIISTRSPLGNLFVQANIRSRSEKDFTVQVQTLFYDRNGMILYSTPGSETPWTTVPLAANATFPYAVQSLTPAAAHFTIRVRYLGRKTYAD